MSFNPYSAGAKRYRGAGTSPNAGRTLDPTGYIDRSATQQAAQSLMNRNGTQPGSQQRSGIAQNMMQNRPTGGGGGQQDQQQANGPSPFAPYAQGTVPIPPQPKLPNPVWQLPRPPMNSMMPGSDVQLMGRPMQTQMPMQARGGAMYAEATGPRPGNLPPVGGMPIPEDRIIPPPGQRHPLARPPLIVSNPPQPPQPLPPREVTGGPAVHPIQPTPTVPTTPKKQARGSTANTSTGRNNVKAAVIAPPKTKAAAPSLKFPSLPSFNLNSALDPDLRAQRSAGYQDLNQAIVQIGNLVKDLQQKYQLDLQGLNNERSEEFMGMGSDFGSRGMLSGSGYGQEYTDLTTEFTKLRNALDQELGSGQRDALASRTSGVQTFQQLLAQLLATQAQRDAAKRTQQALKKK